MSGSIGRKVSTFNNQSILPAAPEPVWSADQFQPHGPGAASGF
jgi:hypothetical protein